METTIKNNYWTFKISFEWTEEFVTNNFWIISESLILDIKEKMSCIWEIEIEWTKINYNLRMRKWEEQ